MHTVRGARAGALAGLAASLLLGAAAAVGACTADPPAPPEPTRTATLSTLARATAGDRLTVTAAVEKVLSAGSFVIRDVDLTNDRLLVLTAQPTDVRRPSLVTVTGTVVLFRYADHEARFGLAAEADYRPFEGLKALVADRVDSLA